MTSSRLEWDAIVYHRIAEPQFRWGVRVLDRLPLRGDETVLDLGCGTGRVTAVLLERLPRGRVIGVDVSANMLLEARAALGPAADRALLVRADALELPLFGSVDAIFSTATFHWVLDPPRLYGGLARALRPGGRLEAQCGGGPNVKRLRDRAHALMRAPRFAPYFATWRDPWVFLEPDAAAELMRRAGFTDVTAGLESEPTPFPDAATYRLFIERVVIRHHLAAFLDECLRAAFLDELVELAAHEEPPFVLDYWRLNLSGRKAAVTGA